MGVVVGEVNATVLPGPEREGEGEGELDAEGADGGMSFEDVEQAFAIRAERRARLIAD